ncbi:unnamed protein product [Adineta ricciae]|uniref:Uncharacterized protein n=1 Tax=Adineta ricciae TaxID=249248 RepID=A0A814M4P7_ADIRI|nr:unnamed protein product [Adineta ricciae]CAF1187314.1 unnamed protein product [Adineta ricciae]
MVSRYHVILVLASVLAVLSIAAIVTLIVLWLTVLTPFEDYSLVIDAGSSHSTIFVYKWPADKSDGLGTTSRVSQVISREVAGGPISSITDTTENGTRQYFNAAMIECLNVIPSNRKSRALIFLGATAGLRLFNITSPDYINRLLNATRAYFGTLGVLFGAPEFQVRIIDGSEEGLSGWITANILLHQLYDNNVPLQTYGVVDMGGASTQLSFIAPQATSEHYLMNLFDTDYDVYSHSYLCYGQDQLRLIYQGQLVQQANGLISIDDPCLQSGYIQNISYSSISGTACAIGRLTTPTGVNSTSLITFRGTGNYSACQELMRARLNKTACSTNGNCSFDGVYQPIPISSSLKFVAFAAVFYAFDTLAPFVPISSDSYGNYDLSTTNLTQIKAAIATVCNQPWLNVTNATRFRPFLCFQTMYHWTLFEYGYALTESNIKNFQIVNKINSNDIGWTLGYMINQTNHLSPEYRPSRLLTQAEFIGILICFIVLLVISLIVLIGAIVIYKRQENPQTNDQM